MEKVNTKKIKWSSDRIGDVAKKIKSNHSIISDSLNTLNQGLSSLRSYNGALASKKIIYGKMHKSTWVVNVSSFSLAGSGDILDECAMKIRKIEKIKDDLDIIADKLSNIIRDIENEFGRTAVKNLLYNGANNMDEAVEKAKKKAKFNIYNLSDDEILQLARLCAQEQGSSSIPGILAEASLIANRFELKNGFDDEGVHQYDNVVDYVKHVGWWANSKEIMERESEDNPVSKEAKLAVKKVFNDGKRVLPKFIDEHDSIDDLSRVETNEKEFDKENTKKYVPYKTVCYQKSDKISGGDKWTYVLHPDKGSDPFGYASENNIKKYGDYCHGINKIRNEVALDSAVKKASQ